MKWWRSRNTDSEDQDETDGKPLFRWERDYNMGKYRLKLIECENTYVIMVSSLLAKVKLMYL